MPTRYSQRMARKDRAGGSENEIPSGPAWANKLNEAIDDLAVNRASIRQEAITTIISSLTQQYAAEVLEPRAQELATLLRRSLSKAADSKESLLAARAIALTFITHSDLELTDQDELYHSFLPALKSTVKNNDDISTKAQCLHTLALATLIAGSKIDTQLSREFVFDLIESEGQGFNTDDFSSQQLDQLLCAALRSYGILFVSSFHEHGVTLETLADEIEKVMPMHEILLESSDKSVRIAAGENVALIFELLRIVNAQGEDDDDDDDEEDDQYEYDNMDDLVRTLKELSMESGRRQSKNSRAEQKSIFRDIVKSVDEGESPIEELKINGRVITFRGWSKILLLNAFRQAIGQGLHHHFQTNDLLRQVFRYSSSIIKSSLGDQDDSDGEDISRLSKPDRQFVYDESKKNRSKQMRAIRNSRKY